MLGPIEQFLAMGGSPRRMGCVQPAAVNPPLFRGDWHEKETQLLSEEER